MLIIPNVVSDNYIHNLESSPQMLFADVCNIYSTFETFNLFESSVANPFLSQATYKNHFHHRLSFFPVLYIRFI